MQHRWKNIVTFLLFAFSLLIVVPRLIPSVENRLFFPETDFVLGLDLQGGTQLNLQLQYDDPGMTRGEMNEQTGKAVDILYRRIDRFGLTQPKIQKTGPDRILVQIPGLKPSALQRVKNVLKTTGNLRFHLVASQVKQGKADRPSRNNPKKNAPEGTIWLPIHEQQKKEVSGTGKHPNFLLVEEEPRLTGEHVEQAQPQGGGAASGYVVGLNLTPEGTERFAEVTSNNVDRQLAIVLDNKVWSAPNIDEPITGGRAQISGKFSPKQAKDLSSILNSGRLQAPIKVVQESSVGPSLGQASIQRGKWAMLSALGIVVLFMILYYWGLGIVVSFVLMLNVLLLAMLLLVLQATLTLPGIAGIILTVGMAVDASVIIFERIREESKKNQSTRKAFETGWNNAFWAVFDANITTLIAAVILYYFGTQSIQGFATTLFLGILTTLFTVFFSEKAIIQGLIDIEAIKEFRMMELLTETDWKFLNKAKITFVFSALLVIGSIGVFAYGASQGGRIFGVEFTGGQLLNVRFEGEVNPSNIRDTMRKIEVGEGYFPYAGLEVQRIQEDEEETGEASGRQSGKQNGDGSNQVKKKRGTNGKTYSSYQIRLKGYRIQQVAETYVPRDMKRIFNDGELTETTVQGEEVVLTFESEKELGTVDNRITNFQYEESFLEPYATVDVTVPGKDSASFSTKNRRFTFELTNDVFRSYLQYDLFRKFSDKFPPRRDVIIDRGERFSFRIALENKNSLSNVEESVDRVFEQLEIDKPPVATPVNQKGEEKKDDASSRFFRITTHPDVSASVDNQYEEVINKIDAELGLSRGPFGERVEAFSAVVAESFKRDAFWAISISWIAILVYLAFRFQFEYGVGAVIALMHDVIFCVGFVALVDLLLPPQLGVNLDIGLSSLAAFLTVVGYSVNDSIITYDRIREIIRNSRKKTLGEIIDEGINLNLSRTVLTSISTFLAAFALFAFTATSGTDVASFAFPILVGVLIGTYSSMFLASPLLVYAPLIGKSEDTRASRMFG